MKYKPNTRHPHRATSPRRWAFLSGLALLLGTLEVRSQEEQPSDQEELGFRIMTTYLFSSDEEKRRVLGLFFDAKLRGETLPWPISDEQPKNNMYESVGERIIDKMMKDWEIMRQRVEQKMAADSSKVKKKEP